MEVVRHAVGDYAMLSLWHLTETEAWFAAHYPLLSAGERTELAMLKGVRRHEWWAGRYALYQLTGWRPAEWQLVKDAQGKPYFPHSAQYHCSLSHSEGRIVGALLAQAPCGLDVQMANTKVQRVIERVLHEEEIAFLQAQPAAEQIQWAHWFWCGKEALYKAYGKRALDFRTDIRISFNPPTAAITTLTTLATVTKDNNRFEYTLRCHWTTATPKLAAYAWSTALLRN